MAGFTYYVPELAGVNAEELVAGLPEMLRAVFREHTPAFRGCDAGPDGGKGQCVKATGKGNGYRPAEQEWLDTGDGYWLGWEKDAKPGPEDLQRPARLQGYDVVLKDGNTWHVPAVTFLERGVLHRNGEWHKELVLPEYQPLEDAAGAYWELLVKGLQREGDKDYVMACSL